MEQEILKLIYKMDFYMGDDEFFFYVCYDKESKNIKYLKYLVENSGHLQWWYRDGFTTYAKKVICINKKI
jgi:hypothetical protein